MLPYFAESFGNASSIHSFGQRARAAVERARESVAAMIGAQAGGDRLHQRGHGSRQSRDFWGGGGFGARRKHVITTQIEHHAVLHSCEALERQGVEVTYLPVNREGLVDPANVKRAIRPETVLITVMHANNEIGTIQPIEEIGRIAREADI